MKNLNRRRFLKTSILAAGSASLLPGLTGTGALAQTNAGTTNVNLKVAGANGDIRIAVVGFNGRGQDHLKGWSKIPGVRVVALCDVDSDVLGNEVQKFKDRGENVQGYANISRLLENKDIDAISIATPNHWHSLAGIWAAQAGKDVYVEKPVSHNVWEGRQLVKAARKHGRIIQTGTQSRSSAALAEAQAWLQAGHLGRVVRARAFCYKRRGSIGKTAGAQLIPPTIDYNLWLGPAPLEPLRRKKLHYDWHWQWAYGCGDLGNQGIHQMDIARRFLGETALSPQVFSLGGRLGYEDDGATPNTLVVCHEYPAAPLLFEVRGLPAKTGAEEMDKYRGISIGNVIDCEGGSLVIPEKYDSATALDKDGKAIQEFKGSGNHYENFIKAVRSRKPADLHAEILEGHLSSALCHTANISYRLGKQMPPEEMQGEIKNNADVLEAYGRMSEHLAANGVALAKTPAALGALLKMDPQAERFTGNDQANGLLKREYRAPFVVPEIA